MPATGAVRVFLVGMMGAGKSTVGRLVADAVGCAYLDSDDEVVAATGLTVPELFAHHGEAAFRDAESAALAKACATPPPLVVSVAGGAVLRAENRALLRASGHVVWLRARPDTVAARVGDGVGRPLLAGDPVRVLRELDQVRRPLYAEVADEVIDVDALDPAEVAGRVVASVAVGATSREVGAPAVPPAPAGRRIP
jgi:shikimate kinase